MFDEKQKAIQLLDSGLLNEKNLSRDFVTLSKYYKYIGLSKERASDLLLDWLKNKKCDIEFSLVISKLKKAVNNVYTKNYKFIHDIKVDIYDDEINYIQSLKSKGEKKVALSLIYLSKIYGDTFYCYHLTLHKLTKISVRHIKRIKKKLIAIGLIDIVDGNRVKKSIKKDGVSVKIYSYPNTYKINIVGKGDVIFSCGDIDDINRIFDRIVK